MEIELLEQAVSLLEKINVAFSITTIASIYIAIFVTVTWGKEEDK